jgi:hydrogenase-4 component E
MIPITPQILFFLETMLFASVVFMHIAKKNSGVIFLYSVQSLIIAVVLFYSSLIEASVLLVVVAVATFLVKVVIVPYFFSGLIKKHRLQFSVSTYLNTPLTLIALMLLTALSYSHFFGPLTILAPEKENALSLAIAMVLVSIFLIINRKGALSQMVGILSLENAIVSFAYVAGLETTAGLQVGILFDIFIWVVIATVFASMIYRHFGSLNVSVLKHLKEE